MLCDTYYQKMIALEAETYQSEKKSVVQAAEKIAASIARGGVLHIFGCGHSHILAEEAFYRAGGLVPVNPILDSAIMLHEGAVKSSAVERMSGYAKHILDRFLINQGDVMLMFSTSGVNSLSIEMAEYAKEKGMLVVVVTSAAYQAIPSRDPSGKHLSDCADILLNNHVPVGDAVLTCEGVEGRIVPSSTILSALLLNMIISQTAEELLKLGEKPKFFTSGNIPGGEDCNKQYIAEYRGRIKML